jgi:hypothetical protein
MFKALMRTPILLFCLFAAGCVSSHHAQVKTFPDTASLKTPAKYLELYNEAKEDFQILATFRDKQPKHARRTSLSYDGGSVFYKGRGYRLISKHRMMNKDGILGVWIGPEITFESPISRIGPVYYSEAKFEPR